jgi:hypothetical protein
MKWKDAWKTHKGKNHDISGKLTLEKNQNMWKRNPKMGKKPQFEMGETLVAGKDHHCMEKPKAWENHVCMENLF